MSDIDERDVIPLRATKKGSPKSISRRALLRGGITAMPAILTLQSGAALARSSNLISASSPDATDGLGRTMCLDTNTVDYASASKSRRVFDLGEPPRPAAVNIITPREYHIEKSRGSATISPGAMCERGGIFWYKEPGSQWQSVHLPQTPRSGVVVSSGAMTSIASDVVDTLI